MPFSVPNAVNYSSPLNAVPLDWTSPPVEGAKGIQCQITWSTTQSGANKAVYVNCQNNATLNFSKIRAIIVDNSANGADIQFIFPDTETTVSVPAYTPYAIIPVFTNQTQFYLVSPNAETTDATKFTILNTAPPPIAVPTTQEQNFFTTAPKNVTAASGTVQLIPATVSGTLEAINISGYIYGSASAGSVTFSITDGLSHTLYNGKMASGVSTMHNILLVDQTDLRLRFQNGLSLSWTTANAPTDAYLSTNLYYRQP
jgi:hypothetical protein